MGGVRREEGTERGREREMGSSARRAKRTRATITGCQAREILAAMGSQSSADLGSQYGISSKAVRDIWCGNTWAQASGKVVTRAPGATGKGTRRGQPRAKLTGEQAREIYAGRGTRSSACLGSEYGISPKAVRDIWSGGTWAHATARGARRAVRDAGVQACTATGCSVSTQTPIWDLVCEDTPASLVQWEEDWMRVGCHDHI